MGGSVMHNLAICLYHLDNQVSGSDDKFFDPSKSRLAHCGLLPSHEGWHPENITTELDMVILGMHAKSDNPELLKAQALGLLIYSFPEFVFEAAKDKTRIVIGGSHGKTSITSMILHVLQKAGKAFDYLVGAQLEGFETMVQLSDAPLMIIEGDEYTTSPLDLRPKFLHYRHHYACITGIAWDHYNVFPTEENYISQFEAFIKQTPKQGKLYYAASDEQLVQLMEKLGSLKEWQPYEALPAKVVGHQTFVLREGKDIPLQIFGAHNLENLSVAQKLLAEIGVSEDEFYQHIQSFIGAAKRMELLGQNQQTTIIKDFAHAPSKLKATSEAVKNQFKDRKLIACLELHTFSSLNKAFIHQYAHTFDLPDEAIIFIDPVAVKAKGLEMMTEQELQNAFERDDIRLYTQSNALQTYLLSLKWPNTNLLLMSSGNFGGLSFEHIKNQII